MKRYRIFLITALVGLSGVGHTETLRVVFAGDGRADYLPRREDQNGLNSVINKEIANAVLKEKAQALFWTGDLVNLTDKNPATFEQELLAWRDIMQPLYDQGVAVLPVRGNHEVMCPEAARVWNKVFSGRYALPDNGPIGEKNLSFFYARDSLLAIGIDEYESGTETVDQAWLDQVLQRERKPFIVLYGHEPMFMDGHHKDTMDVHPAMRDAVWESLIRAGARAYFCGHDHFYDHMIVTRGKGDPGPEMHQFTAGTAGAPFYKGKTYSGNNSYWKLTPVKHIENTYGYILLEIEGNKTTITFKGQTAPGRYEPMDSFSYETGKR